MTLDLKEFTRMRGEIERLLEKASKAEGAYERELSQARVEFGVASVEELQMLLENEEAGLRFRRG